MTVEGRVAPAGTPRRRMAAADRREAILAAALDVFSEGGYHETTLDAVAERAAVSKALIYEHFSSKRELNRALLDRYAHELLGRILEATASSEPGEERLREGADAFLRFVEERPGAWRMVFGNVEDAELAEWIERLREEVAAAIEAVMRADAPAELAADPEAAAEIEMLGRELMGAAQALATWWDSHREVPREQVLSSLMDFAWVGLSGLSAGRRWGRPAAPSAGRERG
jgi:AcrR family transcriptional regulator